MILTLLWIIFLISLSLIALGVIFSKEWSGMAIIGFTFLFLISFIILDGNLEIETGSNVTSLYSYDTDGTINGTTQQINIEYDEWDDSNSHTVGYFMAIISAIGAFSSILITLTKWRKNKK